jgi:hypothetical protein
LFPLHIPTILHRFAKKSRLFCILMQIWRLSPPRCRPQMTVGSLIYVRPA